MSGSKSYSKQEWNRNRWNQWHEQDEGQSSGSSSCVGAPSMTGRWTNAEWDAWLGCKKGGWYTEAVWQRGFSYSSQGQRGDDPVGSSRVRSDVPVGTTDRRPRRLELRPEEIDEWLKDYLSRNPQKRLPEPQR